MRNAYKASIVGYQEKLNVDREGLNKLIAKGPVRILMNDGNEYTVESPEFITVSDIAAAVLYRDEEDGKYRHMHLPLVTMSGVEPLAIDH